MNPRSGKTGGLDPSSLIPEIEKQLTRNPGDAELHMRLAYLYEHIRNNDKKAKFHYLQHLVLTLGYPDDDAALSGLQESLSGDSDNQMAHIYIGLIRAYRDEFDEAVNELKLGTVWKVYELPHYRLNVVSGSTADREIARISEERERAYEEILDLFELPRSLSAPIVCYFYESRVHKALLTGDQMPAHALTKKGEVHSVYGPEVKITGLHEDVHIVLRQLGRPPKFVEEGAAMYADGRHRARFFDTDVSQWVAPGAVVSLFNDEAFIESDTYRSYPLAASFAGFLIESYGVEQFKELYAYRTSDPGEEFSRIYGMSLDELETAWLARLRGNRESRRG